jgi:transposase InsO family protein
LASILDLHSRRCAGFAMGVHHDADLAAAAVCMAIAVRGGNVAGVVLHTDQGTAASDALGGSGLVLRGDGALASSAGLTDR